MSLNILKSMARSRKDDIRDILRQIPNIALHVAKYLYLSAESTTYNSWVKDILKSTKHCKSKEVDGYYDEVPASVEAYINKTDFKSKLKNDYPSLALSEPDKNTIQELTLKLIETLPQTASAVEGILKGDENGVSN